jgi:methylenetetrahydrofolate--tRNA-(uracil-5-)-methyltransferase
MLTHNCINIIGAGLAGVEAACLLSRLGIKVRLFEMKPIKYSEAHNSPLFAELVCSNSLKSTKPDSAAGLLKHEMSGLSSIVMQAAEISQVPAGHALAVDRDKFSSYITDHILADQNIEVINSEMVEIANDEPGIICTGPLTSGPLAEFLADKTGGGQLYFYDAIAPIVELDSIDMRHAFWADRYDDGPGDYLNCVLSEQEYESYYSALVESDALTPRPFEKQKYFESCMPVEVLASRGRDTLLFGPMKPVGLTDPRTNQRPFAVVQLRKEDLAAEYLNLVGFQTKLRNKDQKKVFGLIPALKNASYARFGSIHRNTFINAPRVLQPGLELNGQEHIMLAGQITGVEGYLESAACGIMAGISAAAKLKGKRLALPPKSTALGALLGHLAVDRGSKFQPSNLNFGLFEPLGKKYPKKLRGSKYVERASGNYGLWLERMRDDISGRL